MVLSTVVLADTILTNRAFQPATPTAGSGPTMTTTLMMTIGLSTLRAMDTTGTPNSSIEGIRFREKHEGSFVLARLDH